MAGYEVGRGLSWPVIRPSRPNRLCSVSSVRVGGWMGFATGVTGPEGGRRGYRIFFDVPPGRSPSCTSTDGRLLPPAASSPQSCSWPSLDLIAEISSCFVMKGRSRPDLACRARASARSETGGPRLHNPSSNAGIGAGSHTRKRRWPCPASHGHGRECGTSSVLPWGLLVCCRRTKPVRSSASWPRCSFPAILSLRVQEYGR